MNRNLFMIINEEVKYLMNSQMDHREWYLSLGLDINNYENIVRGFIIDNKIIFFKGSNFAYDTEVVEYAKKYSTGMRLSLNNPNLEIYCGIDSHSLGGKWEPILRLNDNELKDINTEEKKEVNVEKKEIETRPIIEFKNNYTDSKFIKRAVIVTIIVLILSIITKVYLISTMKMHLNNSLDLLLTIGEVVLLSLTIYGYTKKLSIAKYLGVGASVLLILTFNLLDIILGILYFLFSIDQSIYEKLIITIKSKIKR